MARKSATRPARKFDVTLVAIINTVTGETVDVPQVAYSVANIQCVIDSGHNADVRCTACGESVVDCPDLRGLVHGPATWSWRHQDGLVTLTG